LRKTFPLQLVHRHVLQYVRQHGGQLGRLDDLEDLLHEHLAILDIIGERMELAVEIHAPLLDVGVAGELLVVVVRLVALRPRLLALLSPLLVAFRAAAAGLFRIARFLWRNTASGDDFEFAISVAKHCAR